MHSLHSQYKCAPRALTSQPVQVCVPCTHFTASTSVRPMRSVLSLLHSQCTHFTASTSVCPMHSLRSQYKCVSHALTSQPVQVCVPCTHFAASTSVCPMHSLRSQYKCAPMHSLHSQYKCVPHALTSQPVQVCPHALTSQPVCAPCTHFSANQPAGKTRQTLTHCQLPNVADMQQEITRLKTNT